jgi:NADH-quinone oxidoreductase subunit L
MLIATLAISGLPPFSGFFSKDLILASTYSAGHVWLWLLGVITAGLTALYMFRLLFMTFHGRSRVDEKKAQRVREAPPVMTSPLIVLAVFAVVGGWVGLPDGLLWGDAFGRFLAPIVSAPRVGAFTQPAAMAIANVPPAWMLSVVATMAALLGMAVAWILYLQNPAMPQRFAGSMRALYWLLVRKYYVDELYDLVLSRPLFWSSTNVLHRGVDSMIIDGIVDDTGLAVEGSGEGLRKVESGNVQHYAFVYLLGALAIVAYYAYLVMR